MDKQLNDENHFTTKEHGHHQSRRRLCGFCLECMLNILAHESHVWKKKMLLEKLSLKLPNEVGGVRELFSLESPSWLSHLLQSILDFGLSSGTTFINTVTSVVTELAAFDVTRGHPIVASMWTWIAQKVHGYPHALFAALLTCLLRLPAADKFVSPHEETVIFIIKNGLEKPSQTDCSLTCLSLLLNMTSISRSRLHRLCALVFSLLDASVEPAIKLQSCEIALLMVTKHMDDLLPWLSQTAKDLPLLFKRVLLSGNISISATTCKIVDRILDGCESREIYTCFLHSDIFDVISESMHIVDSTHQIAALSCMQKICRFGSIMDGFHLSSGVEGILKCCQSLLAQRNDSLLVKAFVCISELLQGIQQTQAPTISVHTQNMLLRVIKNAVSGRTLGEKVFLQSLEILCQFLRMGKHFQPGNVNLLKEIIVSLSTKMVVLPLLKVNSSIDCMEGFLKYIEVCHYGAKLALQCKRDCLSICTPAQLTELLTEIMSSVDQCLLQLFAEFMEDKITEHSLPMSVFSMLVTLVDSEPIELEEFLKKFVSAGGVFMCLQMKRWEQPEHQQCISRFLRTLMDHCLSAYKEPPTADPHSVSAVPGDAVLLLNQLLVHQNEKTASASIMLLYLIAKTDERSLHEFSAKLLSMVHSHLDARLIYILSANDLVHLATVIAHCWYLEHDKDEEVMKKTGGLLLLLEELLRKFAEISSGVDIKLLKWCNSLMEGTSSWLCDKMITCYVDSTDQVIIVDDIGRYLTNDATLLNRFLMVCFARKGDHVLLKRILAGALSCIMDQSGEPEIINIVESRLVEFCCKEISEDIKKVKADDEDFIFFLAKATQIMQTRTAGSAVRKVYVKLLIGVLKCIDDDTDVQLAITIFNYLVTLLYWSLETNDSCVANIAVEATNVLLFLQSSMESSDTSLKLGCVNVLSVIYQTILKFDLKSQGCVTLHGVAILDALDGSDMAMKLCYLQLWSRHLQNLISNKNCGVKFVHIYCTQPCYAGLNEDQIRYVYLCLQQFLISDFPVVQHVVTIAIILLLEFLMQNHSALARTLLSQSWNDVILAHFMQLEQMSSVIPLVNMLSNYYKNSPEVKNYTDLGKLQKTIELNTSQQRGSEISILSPFLYSSGVSILLMK